MKELGYKEVSRWQCVLETQDVKTPNHCVSHKNCAQDVIFVYFVPPTGIQLQNHEIADKCSSHSVAGKPNAFQLQPFQVSISIAII